MTQKNMNDWIYQSKPMQCLHRQLAITAFVLLTATQPSLATSDSELVENCDRLAASSSEVSNSAGVPFDQIDTPAAVPACKAASELFPQDIKLVYQYGRSLHAANQYREAIEQYRRATNLGATKSGKNISVLALAENNMGSIYRYGSDGVRKNPKLALKLYTTAAKSGLSVAQWNIAWMYELGEGPSGKPNINLAAPYWRILADKGDVLASEKIGLAILNETLSPSRLYNNEMMMRLSRAAKGGSFKAAYKYAVYFKNRNSDQGANYALQAYRISRKAPITNEYSWIMYRNNAFNLYEQFVKAGARSAMTKVEYTQALRELPKGTMKKHTIPINCGSERGNFELFLWDSNLGYPPTDPQIEWLKKSRGCDFPSDVQASYQSLYAKANELGVSFQGLATVAMTKNQTEINAFLSQNSKKYRDNKNAKALLGLAGLLFGGSGGGHSSSSGNGCNNGQSRNTNTGAWCPGKAPLGGVDY